MVPSTETMVGWIEEVFAQGIRRPGYAADDWAERWSAEVFREMGLENVTLDPIEVERWQPLQWSLEVWSEDDPGDVTSIAGYPIPFSADVDALEGELTFWDGEGEVDLAGKLVVSENAMIELPQAAVGPLFASWWYDPLDELDQLIQILPFSAGFSEAMEPSIEAGASAYIGILRGFPVDTDRYYVPYDGRERPIPGLWISSSNGDRLVELIDGGATRARLVLERSLETVGSHNVTATLPGNSDEWIVIGSHHDGPWSSAVEDASGIALVLAQAQYWAQVPREQRPHNLMFLLNGGHMSGGAGLLHFVGTRRDFVENDLVVEIHLEHAASVAENIEGEVVVTDEPEPRWWFTSHIAPLEQAVADAICEHGLKRSFIMPPEGFPPGSTNPPTDAAFFHPHSPIVSFLTAPWYLFDESDTLDKVHRPSLVPLTLATIDIVNAMADHTAASLRGLTYTPPRVEPLSCAEPIPMGPLR